MEDFVSIGRLAMPILDFPDHAHDVWEVIVYTHGAGEAQVGERAVAFMPGTILCVPPRAPHREHSRRGYRNVFIHARDLPLPRGGAPVFADPPGQPFTRIALLLLRAFHRRAEDGPQPARALFEALLAYLDRWSSAAPSGADAVQRLKEAVVDGHTDPGFDLARAMRAIPLAPDYLRKAFLRRTGETPLRCLTRLRIESAARLLGIGGYSVKEVAHRSGFLDPYYFSRAFRAHHGCAPSDYRARPRA